MGSVVAGRGGDACAVVWAEKGTSSRCRADEDRRLETHCNERSTVPTKSFAGEFADARA